MRVNGIGCGGLIGGFIILVIIVNISSCIWDEIQDVIAERHAKQEVADAKARERMAREASKRAAVEARAAELRRIEAEKAERRKQEDAARREEQHRKAEAVKHEAAKFDKLRTFALSDAPGIWHAYQQLEAAIAEQDVQIKDLSATLREFDKDPEKDADYKAICVARSEMAGSLEDIRRKLEEAYLAYCRFKATPNHKEYAELMRKALDDGAQAADEATRKFEQMRVEK